MMLIEAKVGAEKAKHSADRKTYFSGARVRRMDNRLGTIYLCIPEVRKGGYVPFFVMGRKRSELAGAGMVQEVFITGVLTRWIGRERVDVRNVYGEGQRWPCPECGIDHSVYDHAPESAWRQLDTCQFKTGLHARISWMECPTHGVKQVKIRWPEGDYRFMAFFGRLAILGLKETSIEGAGKILRISWDEAWQIMGRAVERGRKQKSRRAVKKMGVDEKSLGKGHKLSAPGLQLGSSER
jgi:hypothetical protein